MTLVCCLLILAFNDCIYDTLFFVADADKKIISKNEFKKHVDVRAAFTALETNMTSLLKNADNYLIMRRVCISQSKAPGGAHLPNDLVMQIKDAQNIDRMLDVLAWSNYWSWIDVRLLETIVIASESPLAIELLNNYKEIIFSKKLIDVLPYFPAKEIRKEKHLVKVLSKFNKDPREVTVADLLNCQKHLEVDILDITKGSSILEYLTEGCIEVHWWIPSKYVDKAFQSATLSCYKFHNLPLQYLQIGSHNVIDSMVIPKPSDTAG